MKDWKAECEQLRGRIQEMQRLIEREQNLRLQREAHADEISDDFKRLLIRVLERK